MTATAGRKAAKSEAALAGGPTPAKATPKRAASPRPERSPREIFSSLISSIDSNLSIANRFAGEAKKRLG